VLLLMGLLPAAQAYPVAWYADLTTTGGGVQNAPLNNWGNSYSYTDTAVTANVTAWADAGDGLFQDAAVSLKAGGSGSCNEPENGNVANCLSGDNAARLDNKSQRDFLLIYFAPGQASDVVFDTLDIFTPKNNEFELTYWIGDLAGGPGSLDGASSDPALLGLTEAGTLSYTPPTNSKLDTIVNFNLNQSITGNAILIGMSPSSSVTSEVYVNSLGATVPLPASVWLLMSAFGALGWFRQKAS